jgi:hypothetical protein
MTAMKRYRWDSAEYAEAFATLLRCYGSREHLYAVLRDLLAHVPAGGAAIDWGAGTGDLTRVLLERARTVYAVEPSPTLRSGATRAGREGGEFPRTAGRPATPTRADPQAAYLLDFAGRVQ